MKQMMIAMMAALLISSAALAQEEKKQCKCSEKKPDKTEMVKHRTEKMAKDYNLTDQQKQQLQELNTRYADKMKPRGRHGHHGKDKMDKKDKKRPELTEEMKQKMESMRKEQQETMAQYDAELQTIMSADQFKAYKADAEKRMREGGRRGGGQRGGQRNRN